MRLRTVLLPALPSSPSAPFAWLAYHGLWGQRERGFNNGTTGPVAKQQWAHPIEWADGLRDSSVTVPGTRTVGPALTKFFCGAVGQVATTYNWSVLHPGPFLAVLVALVIGLLVAALRTRWRPAGPFPVRGRRRGGQIFQAAPRLYTRDVRTFVTLGAVFVPVSLFTAAVQWLLFHLTGLASFVALDGRQGAVTVLLSLLIGDIGAVFAAVFATAAVAIVLREMADERRLTARQAFRATFQRLRSLAAATAIQYGVVLLLTLTVVGIPFAVHRFIRWSLFAQACVLDGATARSSLARSSRLVRGRWWRTFGFTLLVDVLAVLSGLLVGVGLLLAAAGSLNFIDIASSVVYTLTVPLAAIALTLYYFDLEAPGGLP